MPCPLTSMGRAIYTLASYLGQTASSVVTRMSTALTDCGSIGTSLTNPPKWPVAPSVEVATSPEINPGKRQAIWLLTRPVTWHECRALNLRLAAAVGVGVDTGVFDPARIFRLPGFLNVKYRGSRQLPRARLLSATGVSYSPGELDVILPQIPIPVEPTPSAVHRDFDPHSGGADIPEVVKQELKTELLRRGGQWHYDGRIFLGCPFPHIDGPCTCDQAFYGSPHSGRWWCFCKDHPKRDPGKPCVSGSAWSLWAVLFPGRPSPDSDLSEDPETSGSSPSRPMGGDADVSAARLYIPKGPVGVATLEDAPSRKRTAKLLGSVGQVKKAEAEKSCGVPLKGKCGKAGHGFVRERRLSGKTHWCSGCATETSARYLEVQFPEGRYSILRMRRKLDPLDYDWAELSPGVHEIDEQHSCAIAALIGREYACATNHFKRVQRRFKRECLGWHFAVDQRGEDAIWVELQVLVRHSENLERVLRNLTGDTRNRALFQPNDVIRWDYPERLAEQLRHDWAGPLKCALLRIDAEVLFRPIHEALTGVQLSQAYGDLRSAYGDVLEARRNGEREDLDHCPLIETGGEVCGRRLEWFRDPEDKIPLNPRAHY